MATLLLLNDNEYKVFLILNVNRTTAKKILPILIVKGKHL